MRLKSGPGVDAIFCASDNLAVSTLQTLRQMRYSIPEDIAVIGYDNVPISELLYPRLTSIGQPFKEMGRKAINVLIDMIEGRDIGEDRNFIFDPYLLIRDTVG